MNGFVDVQGRRIHGWAFDQQANRPASVDFYRRRREGRQRGRRSAPRRPHGRDAGRALRVRVLPSGRTDGRHAAHRRSARRVARPRRCNTGPSNFSSPRRTMWRAWRSGSCAWDGGFSVARSRMASSRSAAGSFRLPAARRAAISVNGHPIVITTTEQREEWTAHFAPNLAVRHFSGRFPLEREWNDLHFSFGPGTAVPTAAEHLLSAVPGGDARRGAPPARAWQQLRKPRSISRAIRPRSSSTRPRDASPAVRLRTSDQCWTGAADADARHDSSSATRIELLRRSTSTRTMSLVRREPDRTLSRDLARSADRRSATISSARSTASRCSRISTRHTKRCGSPSCTGSRARAPCCLLSVLGGTAVAGPACSIAWCRQARIGFTDAGRNADIDAVTQGSEYYRNVFHLPAYVASVWGKYFEILSIEEAVIGNTQDLVVARKPLAPPSR